MSAKVFFLILSTLAFVRCSNKENYAVVETENPPFRKNSVFKAYEDLTSPRFEGLRTKYRLDTVPYDEGDEFRHQLLLRNWIRTVMQISDFEERYPGEGYAEKILDEALKGQGYHCGHYMTVQNAVMNAYGYVTRCLGAGPGVKGGPDGHHGVNEVWSNTFNKWYLSDAKYNHHFEKNGIPLSALEIRDEYLKNKAVGIVLVKGPDRAPIESDGVANAKGEMVTWTRADFAQTYTWVEYESHNDRYTNWPESGDSISILNMYEDDYFRNNTWIWDGKPHWAYNVEGHLIRVPDRDAIEWTPNTISSTVRIENRIAYIDLESSTPNLRNYQMKRTSENGWQEVSSSVEVDLHRDEEQFIFRVVNLADVTGPEHRIKIRRQP